MADERDPHPRRRTFGPVVLAGLASAGLAAVAATNTWVTANATGSTASGAMGVAFGEYGESPLAAALALVLLAAWGVVLVTRGAFRRIVSLLGVVAAIGFAVTTALAPWQLRSAVEETIREMTGTVEPDLTLTAWWWAAVVASVIACAAAFAGAAWIRHWPEMGTKYDAPTAARATGEPRAETAPTDNIDIWKALDEGRDPTA